MHMFMDVWLHVPDIALDCLLLLNQHHPASTTYKIAELVLYRTSEHKATLGYVSCIHGMDLYGDTGWMQTFQGYRFSLADICQSLGLACPLESL